MAQMDSQPATDLALQPSPVLMEAVLKVEQVVARLQDLQTTISGLHLSPVNPKHTRSSRANAANRVLSSKECSSGKDGTGPTRRRVEYRRNSLKDYKAGSKVQPEQTSKSKAGWNHWSSPANQVHDVISEILMASQFAKQIATLVAEALQEGPQKTQKPADQVQEPKGRVGKDGKRKDIAFPSKAQLQKTMSAKAPLSKSVNRFKVAFPSDSTVQLVPAAKLSRPRGPTTKNGRPASPPKRSISRVYWSNSSSPDSLSPRSPRLDVQSPEKKRRSQRLFSSPESSFRDSGDADDELSYPRRLSMNVTEIRGPAKPWKLTPTKGVLFSNPVYSCSPTKSSAPRPSPVKIAPTSGRRSSWLTNQHLKSPEADRRESLTKRRGNASANPLTSSISKVTFKREGATKGAPKSDLAAGSTKREHRVRKSVVEMVPRTSTTTMFEVLNVRSPPRHPAESPTRPVRTSRRLMPLDANNGLTDKPAVMDRNNKMAKDLQSRDSHSHARPSPNVENLAGEHEETLAHPKGSGVIESSDKENAPVPSCAPAVMFLRSMSSAHTLNRTLSRKNSGGSLLRRAKGWMSSQAVRHGRVLELER